MRERESKMSETESRLNQKVKSEKELVMKETLSIIARIDRVVKEYQQYMNEPIEREIILSVDEEQELVNNYIPPHERTDISEKINSLLPFLRGVNPGILSIFEKIYNHMYENSEEGKTNLEERLRGTLFFTDCEYLYSITRGVKNFERLFEHHLGLDIN